MRRSRLNEFVGFTLVELLVVVAIIVTLLAILMPSMGRAIGVAHLAVCASNSRQLAASSFDFATDRNGLLPPDYAESDNKLDRTFHSRYFRTEYQSPNWTNLGFLHRDGYIQPESYEVFFCPDVSPDGPYGRIFMREYYEPWVKSDGGRIRLPYMFNPHVKDASSNRKRAYVRVSDFPGHPATLLIDQFCQVDEFSINHARVRGFNVTMFDGSVSFRQSDIVLSNMQTHESNYAQFISSLKTLEGR